MSPRNCCYFNNQILYYEDLFILKRDNYFNNQFFSVPCKRMNGIKKINNDIQACVHVAFNEKAQNSVACQI